MKRPPDLLDQPSPQDLDAERALLCAMLIDPGQVPAVAAILEPADFYSDCHRTLCARLVAMHDAGQPIDHVLLVDALRQSDELDAVGGMAYLIELAALGALASHAAHYAGIIRDKALARAAIGNCLDTMAAAFSGELGGNVGQPRARGRSPFDLERARRSVAAVRRILVAGGTERNIRDELAAAYRNRVTDALDARQQLLADRIAAAIPLEVCDRESARAIAADEVAGSIAGYLVEALEDLAAELEGSPSAPRTRRVIESTSSVEAVAANGD